MIGCKCNVNQSNNIESCNSAKENILLIGSPNVGKSSYFNLITWSNSTVGNVDKITISPNKGKLKSNKNITMIDLPGTYTCIPNTKEEEIIIKYILDNDYKKIVNICSIHSLKRDLYLTIELCETQKLKNLLINMIDEGNPKSINTLKLTRKLGVDIELISCYKNTNIKNSVNNILNINLKANFKIDYGYQVEHAIKNIEEIINFDTKVNKRFYAIQYLLNNNYVHELFLKNNIKNIVDNFLLSNSYQIECFKYQINSIRKKFINDLINEVIDNNKYEETFNLKKQKQLKVDKILFNKWVAYPLFILIIFLVYFLTFYEYAGGFFTNLINDGFSVAQEKINIGLLNLNTSKWVADFVSDGLLGGIFTVIGFLPNIAIIFILMSILEQSGLLARLSVLMDKSLSRFGLSGRSVITLLTGIGCNIPSIMMARNAQSKKEKIIILLIAPLISCGARTIAFNWIATSLIGPQLSWLVTLSLTFFSGFVALILGYSFSTTLFRNKKTFLLTEVPFLRAPHILNILKALGIEIWNFIKKVLTIVFLVNLVVFLLSRISFKSGLIHNIDTFYENKNDGSILYYISYGIKYVLYPIGLGYDWRISMSLISAGPAKEIISSTLEQLYQNQTEFANSILNTNIPIAITYSLFTFSLFYMPCFSTIAILKKEGGWKWMFIQLVIGFLLAYLLSFVGFTFIGSIELLLINNSPIYIMLITLLSISFIYFLITQAYSFYLNNTVNFISFEKYKIHRITKYIFMVIFLLITIATNIYIMINN